MSGYPLRGPEFSTYPAEDVGWLLEDFSDLELEADQRVREGAIQSGASHYADSLPVEYVPSTEYLAQFDAALTENSAAVALAAARLATDVHRVSGGNAVLVSLARAGVPAGILVRRLGARYFDAHWPHYAISIVRGRGIDHKALTWLAGRHDPASVVFVDAWTGKGAIRAELTDALADTGFRDRLAVLADPAGVADLAGTTDDLLIPSACLNATVSGLVSRTVNPQPGRGAGHGAKFYRHLVPNDMSNALVGVLLAEAPVSAPAGRGVRQVTWRGLRTVARLQRELGLPSQHLIKPGLGEATRVLLRRIPREVLIAPGEGDQPALRHIRVLAQERGVPIREADTEPYLCIGIVSPHQRADV